MFDDVLIVMPAYNEAAAIASVISGLRKEGFKHTVVIDDGSTDKTAEVAESAGAQVIRHPVNIGVGGATSTGFEYAKCSPYKFVITVDADGQHSVKDVSRLARKLADSTEPRVIIGSRTGRMSRNHPIRYVVNLMSNFLLYLVCGKYVSDTQSGLRGYTMDAIKLINLRSSGYEVCSELIIEYSKNNIETTELPIASIYTDYSLAKGQSLNNILNMAFKVLKLS